jgi:CBS domain-containing protein
VLVADLLSVKGSTVVSVFGTVRLREAAKVMQERRVGALVVVNTTGELEGVVSEREIVEALAESGHVALEFRLSGLVPPGQRTLAPSDTAHDALTLMTERRVRHLAVVSKEAVVGLLSIGDAVKAMLDEKPPKS